MDKLQPFPLPPSLALKTAIEALDLTMPIAKVMDPVEGHGWSAEKARQMERDYRRFLYLTVTQTATIVPTKDIDKMWHAHILDTKKYADDCEALFGAFLHHFPYFGLRSVEDKANLDNAFDGTRTLWREAFGDDIVAKAADCTGGECSGDAGCGACSAVITPVEAKDGGDAALCTGSCSGNSGCSNCGSNAITPSGGIREGTETFRCNFAAKLPAAMPMFG